MNYKVIIISVSVLVIGIGGWYFFHAGPIANYPSKGTDIIAFGDSLVRGIGATEGNDFVSVLSRKIGQPIINLGHSGNTTADGLARIGELDQYNPKVVILLLGGNDFLHKVPIAETRANLSALIQNIQKRGAVVLLLGVRGGLLTDPLSGEFKDLRDAYHTALVSNVLKGLIGDRRFMSDRIHPNDAGYEMIADRVHPVLARLIK